MNIVARCLFWPDWCCSVVSGAQFVHQDIKLYKNLSGLCGVALLILPAQQRKFRLVWPSWCGDDVAWLCCIPRQGHTLDQNPLVWPTVGVANAEIKVVYAENPALLKFPFSKPGVRPEYSFTCSQEFHLSDICLCSQNVASPAARNSIYLIPAFVVRIWLHLLPGI